MIVCVLYCSVCLHNDKTHAVSEHYLATCPWSDHFFVCIQDNRGRWAIKYVTMIHSFIILMIVIPLKP